MDYPARDKHGLPFWMKGEHPTWKKCMICESFVDPNVYKDFMCPACRRDPNEKDMECNECGKMYSRKEMYNNFLCIYCYKEATT